MPLGVLGGPDSVTDLQGPSGQKDHFSKKENLASATLTALGPWKVCMCVCGGAVRYQAPTGIDAEGNWNCLSLGDLQDSKRVLGLDTFRDHQIVDE